MSMQAAFAMLLLLILLSFGIRAKLRAKCLGKCAGCPWAGACSLKRREKPRAVS